MQFHWTCFTMACFLMGSSSSSEEDSDGGGGEGESKGLYGTLFVEIGDTSIVEIGDISKRLEGTTSIVICWRLKELQVLKCGTLV